MSRWHREHPDYDEDDGLPIAVFPPVVRRRLCWCGNAVTPSSTCGCCCLDHENNQTPKDAS